MQIEANNVEELLRRFYDFYDGVVCAVHIGLRAPDEACRIEIHAMDRESNGGWSNVTLTISKVSECRFEVGRTTFEVLSGGIQFGWREDSICVVLDAYPDDGPELPDLSKNTAYVVGATCEVEISELPR